MSDETGRKTREAVIAAARVLFGRYGPAKTSVEEIAREAGFSKATVYNHFTGKEGVVAGVIEYERKALVGKLKSVVDEASDPLEALRSFFVTRFREIRRHSQAYHAGREDFLRHMPQVSRAIERNRVEERKIIEEILERGVEEGLFRPLEDIRLAADILFTTAIGLTFPIFGKPVSRSAGRRIEGLVEFLMVGLCTDSYRRRILKGDGV